MSSKRVPPADRIRYNKLYPVIHDIVSGETLAAAIEEMTWTEASYIVVDFLVVTPCRSSLSGASDVIRRQMWSKSLANYLKRPLPQSKLWVVVGDVCDIWQRANPGHWKLIEKNHRVK